MVNSPLRPNVDITGIDVVRIFTVKTGLLFALAAAAFIAKSLLTGDGGARAVKDPAPQGVESSPVKSTGGARFASPNDREGTKPSSILRTDDAVSAEVDLWPQPPDVMESLILRELFSVVDDGVSPVVIAECTTTLCTIRLNSGSWPTDLSNPDGRFYRTFEAAPFHAFIYETVVPTINSSERIVWLRSFPQTDEELAFLETSHLEMLNRRAESYFTHYPTPDTPPLRIWQSSDGADVIAENVCSHDCQSEVEHLIHVRVPAGRTCDQFNGVEETIRIRTPLGGFEDRNYCLLTL